MQPATTVRKMGMQTAEDFIDELARRALAHEAVHHPFLRDLATGDLPDVRASLRDFAFQYGHYSKHFTRYVQAIIRNLPLAVHKAALQENLDEERGDGQHGHETKPHVELFREFQTVIGVDAEYRCSNRPLPEVENWANAILEVCNNTNPSAGVGAIGLGTELIVPPIYARILDGLSHLDEISDGDKTFFELHTHMDDDHAQAFIHIAIDLAREIENRPQIEKGMMIALNCRCRFWGAMASRSQSVPASKKSVSA